MTAPPPSIPAVAPESLRGLTLFRDLDDGDLEDVAGRLSNARYRRGEEIFGQFEQDDGVYFILAGSVRITVFSAAGKEVTFRDLKPGEMFGELAAIDGEPRSANAIAKSESQVARISAARFWDLLREQPKVNAATLTYLCGLVRDLSARVYQFSAYAVSNRIHAEILRLAMLGEPSGNEASIAPAPTHAEIASRVNTHREAVTREISRLAGDGVVDRAPGTLIVRDLAALKRLAEEISD